MTPGQIQLLLRLLIAFLTGGVKGFREERDRQSVLVDDGARQQREASAAAEAEIVRQAEAKADETAQDTDDANRDRLRRRRDGLPE